MKKIIATAFLTLSFLGIARAGNELALDGPLEGDLPKAEIKSVTIDLNTDFDGLIKSKKLEVAHTDFLKPSAFSHNFKDANDGCAAMGDGWRLPNIWELTAVYCHGDIDSNKENRSFSQNNPNCQQSGVSKSVLFLGGTPYWSSTPREGYGHRLAWSLNFYNGIQKTVDLQTLMKVRCVRSAN